MDEALEITLKNATNTDGGNTGGTSGNGSSDNNTGGGSGSATNGGGDQAGERSKISESFVSVADVELVGTGAGSTGIIAEREPEVLTRKQIADRAAQEAGDMAASMGLDRAQVENAARVTAEYSPLPSVQIVDESVGRALATAGGLSLATLGDLNAIREQLANAGVSSTAVPSEISMASLGTGIELQTVRNAETVAAAVTQQSTPDFN